MDRSQSSSSSGAANNRFHRGQPQYQQQQQQQHRRQQQQQQQQQGSGGGRQLTSFGEMLTPAVMSHMRDLEMKHLDSPLYTETTQVFFADVNFDSILGRGRCSMVYKVRLPSVVQTSDDEAEAEAVVITTTPPSTPSHRGNRSHAQHRHFALKSLNPTRIRRCAASAPDNQNKDASAILARAAEELYREATILAECHHPHIIRLRGAAVEGLVGSFSTAETPLSARGEHGYFLVLDQIRETLEQRLPKWRQLQQPRGITQRLGQRLSRSKSNTSSSSMTSSPRSSPPREISATSLSSAGSMHHNPQRQQQQRQQVEEVSNSETSRGELSERIAVATAIASAVSYLHQEHHIVVRDLCPESIGFDARTGQVKLFDLGLARSPQECYLDIQLDGNFRYMAPEIILCQPSGLPGDIYSFAVLLWQLMTLDKPYEAFFTTSSSHSSSSNSNSNHSNTDSSGNGTKEVFAQSKFTNQVILNAWRPDCAGIADAEIKRLIQECWCSDPEARPNAEQVMWRLEQGIGKRQQQQQQQQQQLQKRSSWRRPSGTATFSNSNQSTSAMERPHAAPRRQSSLLRALHRGSAHSSSNKSSSNSSMASSSNSQCAGPPPTEMELAAARVAADASLYMDEDGGGASASLRPSIPSRITAALAANAPRLVRPADAAVVQVPQQHQDDETTTTGGDTPSLSLADFRSRLQLSSEKPTSTLPLPKQKPLPDKDGYYNIGIPGAFSATANAGDKDKMDQDKKLPAKNNSKSPWKKSSFFSSSSKRKSREEDITGITGIMDDYAAAAFGGAGITTGAGTGLSTTATTTTMGKSKEKGSAFSKLLTAIVPGAGGSSSSSNRSSGASSSRSSAMQQ